MSTTPYNSKEYYWKGADVHGVTADWFYTTQGVPSAGGATTDGLTAGFTAGIIPYGATAAGATIATSLFLHIFHMNAVRKDDYVIEVTTTHGSPILGNCSGTECGGSTQVGCAGDVVYGDCYPDQPLYIVPIENFIGGSVHGTSMYTISGGISGERVVGSAPDNGGTAGCWDNKEHWMVTVDGTTGQSGDGWTGEGYYFAPAVRSPEGGDNVWLVKKHADATIGLHTALPASNLEYGGWNGVTWIGSTSGDTYGGPVIIRDSSDYDFPVGVTTGSGLQIHATEVRLQSNSNHVYDFGAGSSLGYVLSEGTHSMNITDSTIEDLELRKTASLNNTGQYGNFSGRGNTYNSSVSVLGFASGKFVHIAGYGGSAGFVPVINIAPLYRNPITIDVDAWNLAVAPAAKTTAGDYNTIEPVRIISSASNHRRYIKELNQTPENSSAYGQVVGTQNNNPVTFSCGATIENHTFGAGSLGVGSATRETDEITVIDGYIGAGCKVDCIHPNNPRWAGFIIGETHGNTQEGYLVTDESGKVTFRFSRGQFVKANFGDARGAADSSIVSQSGGK